MAAKAILVLCAQALIAQCAFSQYVGPAAIDAAAFAPLGLAGRGLGFDGLYDGLGLAGRGWGCGCGPAIDITATTGGGLPVTSASPIPPVGLSVTSENAYDGILAAAGEVPFVGTIGVEGVLPTAGAGAINYGCGNGVTAMTSEALAAPAFGAFAPAIGAFAPAAGIAAPLAYGAGFAGPLGFDAGIAGPLGYAGWADRGCGCGLL